MGEITHLNPAALPAPSDLERIEIRAKALSNLFYRSHTESGAPAMRILAADIDRALEDTPTLQSQIDAIQRLATKKELADRLSVLRISFPTAKAAGDGFSRVLIERVAAKQPRFGAIDWATRYLIDHSSFLPSIAEVLQALASAQDSIDTARMYVERLPRLRHEIADRIADGGGRGPCIPEKR
jgi:hypothetical protein